jgi:hypothetical protein
MADSKRPQQHGGHHPSKPAPPPGISAAEAQQLRLKVESLEKLVREHFDEKNQWNSMVRGWEKTRVVMNLVTGDTLVGELLWVDRYTICIRMEVMDEEAETPVSTGDFKPVIIHKAAVAFMHQEGTVAAA